MLLFIVRAVYVLVCAGAIATYVASGSAPTVIADNPFVAFCVLLAATQVVTLFDLVIRQKRIEVISAIYFGLLIGVLLSYLLLLAIQPIVRGYPYGNGIALLSALVLPYICISILLQTKDDFRFVIPYVEFSRTLKGGKPLILDSSALIDGRLADVVETKILDSQMIVPQFILKEIQDIADSGDKIRRTRGRRGLDILSRLQNSSNADVRMDDARRSDFNGLSVDQCLIEVAKRIGGRVVTNDFNLNKVASVQGIDVVNLNDVANALRPRYIPGERLQIKIIREGESPGQGVGYLDDGTMVICEQTSRMVGREIDVIVTSVLQSSAGRMIFGRQVHSTNH